MRGLIGKAMVVAASLALTAPDLATARQYDHSRYAAAHHERSCRRARHRRANTGTAVGGVGGALAGAAIGHSLGGALIGGAVGAVAGHTLADRRGRDC
jgi:phage tail tape-measure protein